MELRTTARRLKLSLLLDPGRSSPSPDCSQRRLRHRGIERFADVESRDHACELLALNLQTLRDRGIEPSGYGRGLASAGGALRCCPNAARPPSCRPIGCSSTSS